MRQMIHRIFTSRPYISSATLIAVALCLFFIQSKEKQIQQNHNKTILFNERNSLESIRQLPNPIDYSSDSINKLLYRKVHVTGSFLPDHEIYLENRVSEDAPKTNKKKVAGFHIMAPFQLNTGQIVWVNRGWIRRDPIVRQNIPDVAILQSLQSIDGYISVSKQDIFEMPTDKPHLINGKIVALNFYLHDNKNELPNRDVYPFLITQTGASYDGLIRPESGYLYLPDPQFELRTWWYMLLIAVGFWFISGFFHVKTNSKSIEV